MQFANQNVLKSTDIFHAIAYFALETEAATYKIDLYLNRNLLSESFAVTTYTELGQSKVFRPNQQVC